MDGRSVVSVNTYSYADRARGDKMRKNEGVATMAVAGGGGGGRSVKEPQGEVRGKTSYGLWRRRYRVRVFSLLLAMAFF